MKRLVLTIAAFVAAANCFGADLIVDAVDGTHRNALPQNRMMWATPANDRSSVPDGLQLSHLTLVLKGSPERQLAFDDFLKRQQDPGAQDFHHWLTPVEFGNQFGASLHDLDALAAWLRAQGLGVDAIANSRARIEFSGPAASVGSAFAVRLRLYDVDGEQRIGPEGTPQIPAALSAIVQAVHGLATVHEQPDQHAERAQLSSTPDIAAAFCHCRRLIFGLLLLTVAARSGVARTCPQAAAPSRRFALVCGGAEKGSGPRIARHCFPIVDENVPSVVLPYNRLS